MCTGFLGHLHVGAIVRGHVDASGLAVPNILQLNMVGELLTESAVTPPKGHRHLSCHIFHIKHKQIRFVYIEGKAETVGITPLPRVGRRTLEEGTLATWSVIVLRVALQSRPCATHVCPCPASLGHAGWSPPTRDPGRLVPWL